MTPSRDLLKQIILEINEPILFNEIINHDNNWNKLELNNFIKLLGDNKLPFRVGKNKATIVIILILVYELFLLLIYLFCFCFSGTTVGHKLSCSIDDNK